MSNFIQGESVTFYVSFRDSAASPIDMGVSGTTIDVYHFSNTTLVNDIVSGTMTQQADPLDNVWYYHYEFADNALPTNYNVVYSALFSGSVVQTTETFNLLPATTTISTAFGQGSVVASGIVTNTSGVGIYGVSVGVSSGSTSVAAVTTNVSGVYSVFLNPGQYNLAYFAEGYYPTQDSYTIPSGVTEWNLGTQVLQTANQGTLVISDTYVYQNQNLDIIPIPNLKVSLYENDMAAGAQPIGVAYTNTSGTFVMNADAGEYILAIQGEFWNTNTNKNDRYNYTYNIEVNSVWSGTGPNGNSSPMNFQYGDTSKYNYIG